MPVTHYTTDKDMSLAESLIVRLARIRDTGRDMPMKWWVHPW